MQRDEGDDMTRREQAVSLFRESFSCSQAVRAVFAEEFGLDRKLAPKISQPFGGGIARMGDWCGAFAGAFLVIGLKFGRTRKDDLESKKKTRQAVREFMKEFEKHHGNRKCLDLLGCDIGTPEGQQKAEKGKLHETLCEKLVADTVDLLEKIL